MLLDDVRGFVFDVDGTLVHRAGQEVHLIPGARDVLERVAASGRPYALFTNGSHLAPDTFAEELRAAGLPIEDGQVLTPLCSVQTYLDGLPENHRVLAFATQPARITSAASGSSSSRAATARGSTRSSSHTPTRSISTGWRRQRVP